MHFTSPSSTTGHTTPWGRTAQQNTYQNLSEQDKKGFTTELNSHRIMAHSYSRREATQGTIHITTDIRASNVLHSEGFSDTAGTTQCKDMLGHITQCKTMQSNTIQYSTAQYSTVQQHTIQYSTLQCNTCKTVQYGTA